MPKLKKLPEHCTFPQLAVVLDEARFAARLQARLGGEFADGQIQVRGIKLRRVYYKPGRSCRITFEAKLRAADGRKGEQFYYAKIVPEPKPASLFRRAEHDTWTAPEFGPPVAWIEDLGMVLWAYPNDPNLPGLRILASRDAVAAMLARTPEQFGLPAGGELVDLRLGVGKYVPGQRCGYRYRIRWRTGEGETEHGLYGKAYQKGLGGPAYDVLRQLGESPACTSGRLRIPAPYALDREHDIVWQEMLPGRSFAKDASALDLAAWAGPVASSLAAFHSTSLELGPGLGLAEEAAELEAAARKIARAYPQYAARVGALCGALVAAVPQLPEVPPAPVHGSFKISHVFDVGGRVAFIDFDGAGIGDPTYDVGRFLAHLAVAGVNSKADSESIDRAVERFRAAYAEGVTWTWPEQRVRWYTAALLLSSQAYKCVKRMVPDRVEAIVTAAERWFPVR